MTVFRNNSLLTYFLMPFVLGAAFGVVEFVQSGAEFSRIVSFLLRPLSAAIVIWVVMYPAMKAVDGVFHSKPKPLWLRQIVASALGALPLSVLLPWMFVRLGLADQVNWVTGAMYEDILLGRFLKIFLIVALIWGVATHRWYSVQQGGAVALDHGVVEKKTQTEPEPEPVEAPEIAVPVPQPAFLEKMTKPIGRTPWAIKAEQHYIRVYTEHGDEMILYRFSDAVKGLEAYDGMQVHRSYWVAKAAVEEVVNKGSTAELRLKNDLTVPVSRSNARQAVHYFQPDT